MKKLVVALVVLGLLFGESIMAFAEKLATPEETQKWIQDNAEFQTVPSVGEPVKSTDTVKGSSDTVKGSTDTVKTSTDTVKGSTDNTNAK